MTAPASYRFGPYRLDRAAYRLLEGDRAIELSPKAIYEQRRYRSLGGEAPRQTAAELVRGNPAPVEIEVVEDDLRFVVDVTAPLSTGLFADLREGRVGEQLELLLGRRHQRLAQHCTIQRAGLQRGRHITEAERLQLDILDRQVTGAQRLVQPVLGRAARVDRDVQRLQHVAREHRQRKQQQAAADRAFGEGAGVHQAANSRSRRSMRPAVTVAATSLCAQSI